MTDKPEDEEFEYVECDDDDPDCEDVPAEEAPIEEAILEVQELKKSEETEVEAVVEDTTAWELPDADDFDFIDHYGEEVEIRHQEQLDDNSVESAINFGVIGVRTVRRFL